MVFFHVKMMMIFKGGYGTMEELLEVITWSQLGIHEKPVRIFNFIYTYIQIYNNIDLFLFDIIFLMIFELV